MTEDAPHTDAESTVATLEAAVEELRAQLEQNATATRIGDALAAAVLAEEIVAPATHQRLLEMIVETAASVISAKAGALFLIDEQAGDLVFQVALGGSADEVKQIRMPLGHGIAGGVALSGLPIAVSNASSDRRWAKDIGEKVDYVPESIVCVPLFYEDRVIGALELLDKEGAPSFTPADLHTLSLFANQAGVTIEQSRTRLSAGALLAGAFGGDGALAEGLRSFGEALEHDPRFADSLELARLVREIAQAGEKELAICREILNAFAGYLRSRPK
jgi:GAF domain-containing protein